MVQMRVYDGSKRVKPFCPYRQRTGLPRMCPVFASHLQLWSSCSYDGSFDSPVTLVAANGGGCSLKNRSYWPQISVHRIYSEMHVKTLYKRLPHKSIDTELVQHNEL